MNNTTPATSVADKASDLEVKKLATATTAPLSGLTTTSVKIAKQRGKSTSNSPQSAETTMSINYYERPIGQAVQYLNGFHFGEFLPKLNRAARLVPTEVQGWASIVASTPNVTRDQVEIAIRNIEA